VDSASVSEGAQGIRFIVATLASPLHGARNVLKRNQPFFSFDSSRCDNSWIVGNPSLTGLWKGCPSSVRNPQGTWKLHEDGCRYETRRKRAGIRRWKPISPPTPFLRAEGSHPFSRFWISPAKVQRYIAA
jgi:hypothetical protein